MSENQPVVRQPLQQEMVGVAQTPLVSPEEAAPVRKEIVIEPEAEAKPMSDEDWQKKLEEARNKDDVDKPPAEPMPQTSFAQPPQPDIEPATVHTSPQHEEPAPADRLPETTITVNADDNPTEPKKHKENYKFVGDVDPNSDISYVVTDLSENITEFAEAYNSAVEEESNNPIYKGDNPPVGFSDRMSMSRDMSLRGHFNQQQVHSAAIYKQRADNGHPFIDQSPKTRPTKVAVNMKRNEDGSVPVLRGAEALLAVRARQLGIYKVTLYNSGFWISLTPLTLSDMSRFVQSVDIQRAKYGHVLGGFSFHYHDMLIRESLMELIADHLVDSNVAGLGPSTARDMLPHLVSYHDYELLALYACVMVNPKGTEVEVPCPKCHHTERIIADLPSAIQLDGDLLNTLAQGEKQTPMEFLEEGNMGARRTPEEIAHYQHHMIACPVTVVYQSKNDRFRLRVPTMHEYLSCGHRFLSKITSICNGSDVLFKIKEKHGDDDKVRNEIEFTEVTKQIQLNVYKMYVPWIERITMLDADGNDLRHIEDPLAIEEAMNLDYGDNTNITSIVTNYQNSTRATFCGLYGLFCNHCGKRVDFNKNDFFVLEPSTLFFAISLQKLTRTGISV